MNSKRTLGGALKALAITSSLTAASLSFASTLTVSSPQDPGSWDPIDTFLVNWASVATNIYDGLTYRGPDLKLQPGLATSWEQLDDSKRIRFTLRQDVKFHDGEDFNAAAVKFTFDRLMGNEGKKGPQRSNYSAIDSVEVIDDYTVDFHLKAADPVLLTKLAGYGAMIVPPKYIQEKGEDFFNTHPVGTGPFKFSSYEPKVGIKLEAYADHWGGAPKLTNLNYRFISEPSTAVAELQSGRVDLVIPPTIPIGMITTIEKNPNLEVITTISPTVYALRFNTKNGITKDEKVRKALIYGVDRQAIIDSILGGQAAQIASFQSAISFGDDPSMAPLPYDPNKAMQLLKQAGIKPGTKIQIDIRGNNATFNEVSQAVASYLQIIGLNATIKPYETNVLLNDIIPAGKTGEMFQQSWGGWTLDYDNTAYFMYHTGEKWNPYDSDPALDKQLESQRSITDRAKRLEILQSIANYTANRALEMPLYSLNAIFGVSKRVKNFTPVPDSRLRLTDVTVE
ncbi:ABC transporter substrate-binding protein [Marinomonas rhizomae]|uniref:Peptide/nickel transport system substrate-binding protein n=1 Tax=Marinomonas rhizomae TaxID=491948 RepID=A0A366JFV2_9GAMM|nr:ABC transporter substrate-binding protein [Marinomonas rhizomae]RBP85185.1 peptide/nickel transport system substrate-binding protein [Marinomonas rhizomae]RNF76289.1 ABC transporter substrate-binding protein [Marinomonas rhizomae]